MNKPILLSDIHNFTVAQITRPFGPELVKHGFIELMFAPRGNSWNVLKSHSLVTGKVITIDKSWANSRQTIARRKEETRKEAA